MPSYRGILGDADIESVLMLIQSLAGEDKVGNDQNWYKNLDQYLKNLGLNERPRIPLKNNVAFL